MPKNRQERVVEESESDLEKTLRASTQPEDATYTLTQLLSAFDAWRRSNESLAIEQTAQALQRGS